MSDIKNFESVEDANDWMEEVVDDPCIDNYRFAFTKDLTAMDHYEQQREQGCCGSFDAIIMVNNIEATIGCNYGH